jgi:hypothetical protein
MVTETSDVPIQEETVLRQVQERTQPDYQFRRAFRDYDASGNDAETLQFPVPDDDLEGHVVEIGEGSDYPRGELNYSEAGADRAKYGFEMPITDEAVRFGRVDIEAETQAEMARANMKNIDQRAYDFLANNNNDVTVGNDGEDLDFEAVVEAYEVLYADEYNPSEFEIYVGPDGGRDLSLDDSFNRATEEGDMLTRDEGITNLGTIYGIPVYMTNTGDLGDDEAIMVDTSKYGYYVEWVSMEVESYREDSNDQWVYKLRKHDGFAVTDAQAAVLMQGGASGA